MVDTAVTRDHVLSVASVAHCVAHVYHGPGGHWRLGPGLSSGWG